MRSSSSSGSPASGTTTVPPLNSTGSTLTPVPPVRKKGATASVTSSLRKSATEIRLTTFHVMLPCVSITPFGSPVVPEVCGSRQRSSNATASSNGSSPRSGDQLLVVDVARRSPRPRRRDAALLEGSLHRQPSRAPRRRWTNTPGASHRLPRRRGGDSPAPGRHRVSQSRRALRETRDGWRRASSHGRRARRRARAVRARGGRLGPRARHTCDESHRESTPAGSALSAPAARSTAPALDPARQRLSRRAPHARKAPVLGEETDAPHASAVHFVVHRRSDRTRSASSRCPPTWSWVMRARS